MLFGGEIGVMLLDMRWAVMLLLLLVIADFRFGWGESSKRYHEAVRAHDELKAEMYRWHTSRAVRRTLNKMADYIVIMLMCGAVGMAVFEPVGIDHTWGAWVGAVIACGCEVASITGHFCYLRGVRVGRGGVKAFLKSLLVALIKRKDKDVGGAVEDAFNNYDKEEETDGDKG